jgi:exodeoxyribonuclease-3
LRSIAAKTYHSMINSLRPDVLCLQETKISDGTVLPDLGDFSCRHINCAVRRGYGGTAVFSKIDVANCGERSAPMDMLLSPSEGRVQLLEFERFYLVNVYVPNAGAELGRLPLRRDLWDRAFCDFLCSLALEKSTIACGDFNVAHEPIDIARPAENRGHAGFTDDERRGFGAYGSRGFVDVFRHLHPDLCGAYSWWSYRAGARLRNVGWRIDYFLVTEDILPLAINCEIAGSIGGSDHAPVVLDLDCN